MRFATVRELSRSPSKYVNMVADGECVIITRNGKPTAVLSEITEEDLEDFILARHLDLEGEFQKAKEEHERAETMPADEFLSQIRLRGTGAV